MAKKVIKPTMLKRIDCPKCGRHAIFSYVGPKSYRCNICGHVITNK